MYLLGNSECLMPLNPGVMVWVGVRVKQCAGYSCYLHELVVYLCQAEKYLILCETVLVCVLVLVFYFNQNSIYKQHDFFFDIYVQSSYITHVFFVSKC